MILDLERYESTSRSSAVKILCACDSCGVERLVEKLKLSRRGGANLCQPCSAKAWAARNLVGRPKTAEALAKRTVTRAASRRAKTAHAQRGRLRATCEKYGVENLREFVRAVPKGPDHYRWLGGVTAEMQRARNSLEAKAWRHAIFARDDYTCAICHKRGGALEADHLKPFGPFPELRFDLGNGRTLCRPCHRQFGARVHRGVVTRTAQREAAI